MLKVGLTGGLASGKSFVGAAFEHLGCKLIEADKLGHEVLLPGGSAFPGIDATAARRLRYWGLASSGETEV